MGCGFCKRFLFLVGGSPSLNLRGPRGWGGVAVNFHSGAFGHQQDLGNDLCTPPPPTTTTTHYNHPLQPPPCLSVFFSNEIHRNPHLGPVSPSLCCGRWQRPGKAGHQRRDSGPTTLEVQAEIHCRTSICLRIFFLFFLLGLKGIYHYWIIFFQGEANGRSVLPPWSSVPGAIHRV